MGWYTAPQIFIFCTNAEKNIRLVHLQCISMIELCGVQPVLQEKGEAYFFFFCFHPTIVAFPAQKVTTKLIGCKVGAQTDLSQPLLLVNRGRPHNCLFASFPERRQASCFKLLLKRGKYRDQYIYLAFLEVVTKTSEKPTLVFKLTLNRWNIVLVFGEDRIIQKFIACPLSMNYLYWSPLDLRFKSGQVSQEDGNADQAEQPDIVLLP